MRNNYYILVILIIFSSTIYPQNEEGIPKFKFRYVRSISTSVDINHEESFGEKVMNWFFGDDIRHLIRPMAQITDENGNLIVLDQGGGFIAQIDTIDEGFEQILYEGEQLFTSLVDICKYKDGKYLITDSNENTIFIYDSGDHTVTLLQAELNLNQPTGIAYNSNEKEIWVVQTLSHKITVLDDNGNFKRDVGIRGTDAGQFNCYGFTVRRNR